MNSFMGGNRLAPGNDLKALSFGYKRLSFGYFLCRLKKKVP
jgi:hypothetical protein